MTKRIELSNDDDFTQWGLQFADIEISDDRLTDDGVTYYISKVGVLIGDSYELDLTKQYKNDHNFNQLIDGRVSLLQGYYIEDWINAKKDSYEQ